jgi:glutamine amidotransferase
MDALRERDLEDPVLAAVDSGRPFLAICVGVQMLFDRSEETPGARGLGVLPGTVAWLPPGVKHPQMQWNQVVPVDADDPMFSGLGERPWFYFVHSLHGVPDDPSTIAATCDYGGPVNAAFRRGNVFAAQFHPEKSAAAGLGLLGNFVSALSVSTP